MTMKDIGRVFEKAPHDARLFADRHTDTVFPITRFSSRDQVERRREELRFNLRMAAGLYPWPEKTPLEVRREPVAKYDGCDVEKIMFQTRPGFWSTGNLYMPANLTAPAPAILSVIGHWPRQRLVRAEDADYPQQLVNFARMGFVCLVTDMIGMVDSRQISHEYGGGEKELWCSNGLGVQLWNNIRALDLLCSLPQVDGARIGVTGASGGGSQSLFLALADDRIKAVAPINMISLRMQGGCACENAPGLRRDTDNGEMCAVLAPRPLFLAGSTGDWTDQLETVEYPAVLEAYRQYGAEDAVDHYYQVADHQYNAKTRRRVYRFFARALQGRKVDWEEQPVQTGDMLDFTWFRDEGCAPGLEGDEAFFAAHKAERQGACAALPKEEKKRMLRWITGIRGEKAILADGQTCTVNGVTIEKSCVVSDKGQQIPFVRLTPPDWDGRRVCLALGGGGKKCLEDPRIEKILSEGSQVVSGDLFLTGEFDGAQVEIAGPRGKQYYTTFHYTDDAFRVQDVALLWQIASSQGTEHFLWAEGSAARAAACALPLLEGVSSAALDGKTLADPSALSIPGLILLGGPAGCLDLADCQVERF